jgi:GntR family transcriptional regulator
MFEFFSRHGQKTPTPAPEFTSELRSVLQRTREVAARLQSLYVGIEHILLATLASPEAEAYRLLISLGVRADELRSSLETTLAGGAPSPRRRLTDKGPEASWSSGAKNAIMAAVAKAQDLEQAPVSSGHLLLAVLADPKSVASRALAAHGITLEAVTERLQAGAAPTAKLQIDLDDSSDHLIYEQIVAQIQEAIATGQLHPGQRLPPIRQLADQLEVAPGTVARAYAQLESAGTVTTDRARGTFVATPTRDSQDPARPIAIRDLLRPAVVAAFHLGASAEELRKALAEAMADIYPKAA